jgi:2-polyprenyl-3-methyl-5-hydroxy-6-metoxy-1,4-benzoquinol methylase
MVSITLTERDGCPLCGGHEPVVFIPFPEIPVVRCGTCRFIYSSRILSGPSLTSYYEANFGSERHRLGQLVNSTVNAMALERLVDFRRVRTMLDVGTGYGFLLKELSARRDIEVTGVELSRQEADYARQVLGLNMINSSLGDSGLPAATFDLITTFEVIEHVPYPTQFLHELIDYLRPGGQLVVMTDNFESRMAQSLGAGFPKWIPHSHISHFSPSTLMKALQDTKRVNVVRSLSFTPWEVLLRDAYYRLRGIRKTPSEAFDFEATLANEMHGAYRLFPLRKLLNSAWARLALSKKMDGDLMYFVCERTDCVVDHALDRSSFRA